MERDYKTILERITEPLLQWFINNARELPWRQTREAYFIWVSEIMLQQTRVEAVKGYYYRFVRALPNIAALAEIEEEALLKLWEGLGYYNRVRNMQKAAKMIVREYGGSMPADYDAILSLPGIGSYTAGAISSIAFQLPYPAVDGNVLRVLSRALGSFEDIAKASTKRCMEELIKEVIPKERPGMYNQALMELGATVCGPNWEPRCADCPLNSMCTAHLKNITDQLPVKAAKKPRRIEEKTIMIIFDGEKVALQKRPEEGLLAGLYEFPKIDAYVSKKHVLEYIKKLGLVPLEIKKAEPVKHVFTHVEWHMRAYFVTIEGLSLSDFQNHKKEEMIFADIGQINERYPIPSAFSKYRTYLKKV